jgi:Flp pilus assembly protein TadG
MAERNVRETEPGRGARDERGVSMVFVAVALTALLGASALAVDVGALWVARTQLQNGADAAALGAAANMIDVSSPSSPVVTLSDAEAMAQDVGSDNLAISALSLDVLTDDVTFGNWDLDTRTFDTGVDLSDPEQVTAVQVKTRLDDNANGPLPAFMSRILGREEFDVTADAIAYLGWAGKVPENTLVLPIAIDCCKLAGPDCQQDYCDTVATPPNACSLSLAPGGQQDHDVANGVSCLEFNSTPEQNACWTQFEHNPSINTNEMTQIIEDEIEFEVAAGEEYYVDNGTKTPVIDDINDRFLGEGKWSGGNGAGEDRYAPFDGIADSWVITLPVIECQTGIHCAQGTETEIVGFVCFEVREVEVNPGKIIRGRFLCPTDPLFEAECDITTGTGGLNFGIRADIPVLVQ